MAKAENALDSIGISIRGETADSLRGIEEIIDDVADAWDTLSDSQKQAVSEAMAGTQRSSMFSALIENYEKVKELRDAGLGAEGELAKANQVRVESLAGIQGQLEVTKEALYATIISDQEMMKILKGTDYLLQGLTVVVKFIKSAWIPAATMLITSIYAADKAMMSSKWGVHYLVLEKFVPLMKSTITQFVTFNSKLSLSKQGLIDFTKGIKLTKLGMASLIGVAIQVGVEMYKSFKRMTPGIEELRSQIQSLTSATQEFSQANSNLEQVKADTSSMREMVKIIEDENQSIEVQQQKAKEVNELLAQHASSYTSIESILKNENLEYESRIKLLERAAELEKQEAQTKAVEELYGRDWKAWGATTSDKMLNSIKDQVKTLLDNYSALMEMETIAKEHGEATSQQTLDYIESLSLGVDKQKNAVEGIAIELANYYMNIKQLYDDGALDESQYQHFLEYYKDGVEELKKITEETDLNLELQLDIEEFMGKTVEANQATQSVKTKLGELSTAMSESGNAEATTKSISELVVELKELEDGSDDAEEVLKLLQSTFSDMPKDIDTLADAIDYLNGKFKETSEAADMKDLNKSYLEALEGLEDAQKLLDSFKDGLDVSEMRNLFDSELMADYNGSLNDTATMLDHIKGKMQELKDQSYETSVAMVLNNNETWEQMTQDMAESLGVQVNGFQNFVNELGGLRQVDIQNAKNSADAQLQTEMSLVKQGALYYAGFINSKGENRKTDMKNVENFLNQQGVAEAATIKQLAEMWAQYYKAKKAEITATIDKFAGDYGDLGNVDPALMSQLNSLNRLNNNMNNYFENIKTGFSGVQASLNQAIANTGSAIGSATKPSSGGKSSKGGSKDSSEKEIADLDLKIDRYYDLQDAINDVNNALKKNQALQESATGAEKAKLMKEEIKLYKEQSKAVKDLLAEQEKERKELEKTIKSYGGSFDSNGDIKNRQKWLQGLQNQVNSLSGSAKEAKKSEIEGLMQVIEAYEKLHNDTIPSTQIEYQELANTIKKLEKEHLEYVTDLQKNITSAYENEMKKRTEATKSEIEKRKEILASQYDEENYERNLASERRKLDEIQQQIDSARRDTSESGRLYLQQLMEEFAEQEKVINDMIRDREHELGQSRFDEEIDKLDKELEDALDPKNIADLLNQAISKGYVTIGNETIQLNKLMSDWLDETSDGLYAVGNLLKSEMIDNLQTVKTLMKDIGILSLGGGRSLNIDYAMNNQSRSIADLTPVTRSTPNVSIGSLLTVEGNVTEDVLPQVESMIRQSEQTITRKISDALDFK